MRIGIIGAGIAGLHLALLLQRHGVRTRLFVDRDPQQLRESRLPSIVCRFARARARERLLGVDHWSDPDFGMLHAHVRVRTDPPIAFCARLTRPGHYADMRVYLPQLMEDYMERGGELVSASDPLACSAPEDDLTVVAVGAARLAERFPRDAQRSCERPRRLVLGGLFGGIEHPEPMGGQLDIVPGAGEIFQAPIVARAGRLCGLSFEAIPDGPWQELQQTREMAIEQVFLELLEQAGSDILERVDRKRFALAGPLDLLRGAVTPTVRRPWTPLDDGWAVALGDAAVLNDPVTGQGANLAAAQAWELGHQILAGGPFDEDFCRRWERRLGWLTDGATAWTNAALDPPPPHVVGLFDAAARHQAVADALLDQFDEPGLMWQTLATPEAADAFARLAGAASLDRRAALARERRLIDALRDGATSPEELLAPESLLVTAAGALPWRDAGRHGELPAGELTELRILPLGPRAQLVNTRLDTLRPRADGETCVHCTSVWQRTDVGWRVVTHHQAPGGYRVADASAR